MDLVDVRQYGARRRPNALARNDTLHGDKYAYLRLLVYVCLDVCDNPDTSMFPKLHTGTCRHLLCGCVKGPRELYGADIQGKL